MIFPSRRRGAPDSYLDWKVRIFLVGAVLALAGIGLESSLVVGLATVVLLLGLGLRFIPGGDAGVETGENDERVTSHEDQDSDS